MTNIAKLSEVVKIDNGVNVEVLLAAREALEQAPEAAQFKWRASCEWINGAHSRSTIGSVLQLNRWGLLPTVMGAGTSAIRTTTFHYGRESIGVSIKPEHGVEHLCAPRRTVLDRILVDAARSAGTDVRHGVTLCELQHGADNRVIGAWLTNGDGRRMGVRCDVLIGADGRQSAVARLVQAESYAQGTGASGCVYGYFQNVERDGSHWHFVENAAAGVIPTNDGQHCVFASLPRSAFTATFRGGIERAFLQVLEANSAKLSADIARARQIGRLHGFAGVPGHIRQSHGPGWALVVTPATSRIH